LLPRFESTGWRMAHDERTAVERALQERVDSLMRELHPDAPPEAYPRVVQDRPSDTYIDPNCRELIRDFCDVRMDPSRVQAGDAYGLGPDDFAGDEYRSPTADELADDERQRNALRVAECGGPDHVHFWYPDRPIFRADLLARNLFGIALRCCDCSTVKREHDIRRIEIHISTGERAWLVSSNRGRATFRVPTPDPTPAFNRCTLIIEGGAICVELKYPEPPDFNF
jgi:hypothetical protein